MNATELHLKVALLALGKAADTHPAADVALSLNEAIVKTGAALFDLRHPEEYPTRFTARPRRAELNWDHVTR